MPAVEITEAMLGAVLHVLAGAGHFTPFETPTDFNTVLRSFLET